MEFIENDKISTIKKGDVVWLKSGGPEMTVQVIDTEGNCICLWFRHGEILRYTIESCALTKINPFYSTDKKTIIL